MTFRFLISFAVMGIGLAVAPASAQSAKCVVMQKTLQPQGAELTAQKATRDALAEEVELLGEAWENQEATRSFSAEEAEKSDLALAEYNDKKQKLLMLDNGLQASFAQYNKSVSDFNRSCVKQ